MEELAEIAGRLMAVPTAPYYEAGVREVVETICEEHGLNWDRDEFGNVLVRMGRRSAGRPLVLAAHLDHPGFEVVKELDPRRVLVRFQGGVPDSYFRPELPLRLVPGNVSARLGQRLGKDRCFEAHRLESQKGAARLQKPQFAVWEVEDFAVRKGRIYGRACDDLVGVAAILATFIQLKRRPARTNVNVIGVLSRAEEIGFQGALAVAASKQLPKQALIISLETSKELPPVKMGQGVILRVGDRASVFDPVAMRYLSEVAAGLTATNPLFNFQRALMSGGACEGTAYQECGFQTGAVCIALGNYHNCDPEGRIAAEYVSLADACGMVELLVAAAQQMPALPKLTGRLAKRLDTLLRTARRELKKKQAGAWE